MRDAVRRRRLAWFDAGVRELNALYGAFGSYYMCPLSAVDTRQLTDEHVPPKSQGGKALCLTCVRCNNQAGAELDSHLATADAVLDFVDTDAAPASTKMTARFRVGGKELLGEVQRVGDGITFAGIPKANPPGAPDEAAVAFDQVAHLSADEQHFGITIKKGWVHNRARLSAVRSAYLVMFASSGYAYAFHQDLRPVREQIREPDREIAPSTSVHTPGVPTTRRAVVVISEPDWLRSVAVTLGRRTVFLPIVPDLGFFARVNEELRARTGDGHESYELTWRGRELVWPSRPVHGGG